MNRSSRDELHAYTMKEQEALSEIGVVIIGRNEGQRLARCLRSVSNAQSIVYVDSGSQDGSVCLARSSGAVVMELDLSAPFTAARARNAGYRCLRETHPHVRHVQFVDADCEIAPTWIGTAHAYMSRDEQTAAVCGDLLEREPERSLYNRLCELEWKGVSGEVKACGGIVAVRCDAFEAVKGFDDSLIAGEEPELCYRLRTAGWKIVRLPEPMATHDAAITSFKQWWRRTIRAGHAYAERAWLHRRAADRPWSREVYRDLTWGLLVPAIAVGGAGLTNGATLSLLLLYPIWMCRIYRGRRRSRLDDRRRALLFAAFCMLGKVPSAVGQILFHWRRIRRRPRTLIEYKGPAGGGLPKA